VAHSIEVPSEIIRKWQEIVNLLAEIMHVPSASIMRVDPPHIKVFVSSTSKGNPCEPGALDTGPYCETVMKTGQPLLVPDALENEAWKANPHVRLGMISYLGVPIGWPDGRILNLHARPCEEKRSAPSAVPGWTSFIHPVSGVTPRFRVNHAVSARDDCL
jgi:GAF domain-containing protein